MTKLLAIAIPTYNRAGCLDLLLKTLEEQLSGFEHLVDVIVSNNASTDGTRALLDAWSTRWMLPRYLNLEVNVGAEENFCRCLDVIDAKYFWVLGDDDMPKSGVMGQLLKVLQEKSPDLVYMKSEWVTPLVNADQGEQVADIAFRQFDQLEFAHRVHVWFTFISGMVVNRQTALSVSSQTPVDYRKYKGSQLVQLGWTLPALKYGRTFLMAHQRCVLATKGNSGGYALLTVFGASFGQIVSEVFGARSAIASTLIDENIRHHLPGIIWETRVAGPDQTKKNYVLESPWPGMRKVLQQKALFWLFITPLIRAPRMLAMPFYQLWRIYDRVSRDVEAWRFRSPSAQAPATPQSPSRNS